MDENALILAFVGDVCLSFLGDTPTGAFEFPEWPAIKHEIGEHDFLELVQIFKRLPVGGYVARIAIFGFIH